MKYDEILLLCKAGYTAEQIEKIAEQTKHQEKQPQQEKQPDTSAELIKAISALTEKIQTLNIQNSTLHETSDSVDDILASVILPKRGEK